MIARVDQVAGLPERLGTRLHVVGQVESMPYLSCHFDVVTASQTLHHFAPGLALTEIARVLKPGGHLAVAYNTRDDTVPWVKRLIALMHRSDPEAMRGDFGVESVQALIDSPYFVCCATEELPQLGADHPIRADRHGRAPTIGGEAGHGHPRPPADRGRPAVRHLGPPAGTADAALPDVVLAGRG